MYRNYFTEPIIHPTRKSENAVRFLGEFEGFLVCDGYAAYNALQNTRRV
ncbi:MAG: hypothetical protein E7498_03520 [Ruminococcus sp.]|nr:hypothetical protein [Ruminococcus sp.]MBQ7028207.1 transposase [Ruminococcus sp.]